MFDPEIAPVVCVCRVNEKSPKLDRNTKKRKTSSSIRRHSLQTPWEETKGITGEVEDLDDDEISHWSDFDMTDGTRRQRRKLSESGGSRRLSLKYEGSIGDDGAENNKNKNGDIKMEGEGDNTIM